MTTANAAQDIKDETLMALADGELAAGDAAALRARIAADPALAERFAIFVETRALLEPEHMASVADEPGLDRLAAMVRAAARKDAAPEAPKAERRFAVVEGGAPSAPPAAETSRPSRPAARFRIAIPAMAASLAFVVGGLLGYGAAFRSPDGSASGGIVAVANAPAAETALARALQGEASGQAVAWTDASGLKGAVSVIATHRLGDGRFCREYEVRLDGAGERSVGLGCRGAGEPWRTELVARAPDGGGYAKASGETVAESALADLGSAGALSEQEEAALIKGGWTARRQ